MTLASNLRENKAVYAVAGAGDFAVEKIREMPEQMTRYQGRAREISEKYQGEVRETARRYRGQVREAARRYRGQVREAARRYRGEVSRYQDRVDAKDLPGAAVAYATEFGTRAVGFFDDLAERGKRVVHRDALDVAGIAGAPARPVTRPAAKPAAKARAPRTAQPGRTARAAQPGKGTRTRSTAKKNGA